MSTVAAPIRLCLKDNGLALTLDEFFDAEECEGYRYELARGVPEVALVPRDEHGLIVSALYEAIGVYKRAHPGIIHRFGGGSEIRLWIPGVESGRNPDVAVILRNAPQNSRGNKIPSLAMGVVFESKKVRQRDYVTKREEYLAYGLLEYWIVDPFEEKIVVLFRDGFSWVEHVFKTGENAEGLVCPAFKSTSPLFGDEEV